MLILLSPAKTLDYESALKKRKSTTPLFADKSAELVSILEKKSSKQIASLMKLSEKLASVNAQRYNDWTKAPAASATRQALLAFKGDVYLGLQAETLDGHDLNYAQKHLRILSGLYGLLRPLDAMQPYRLEMGTRLSNSAGKDLYAFWRETLTATLNEELAKTKPKAIINLASNEYFSAIDSASIDGKIISPAFKDYNRGDYKILSFFAKRARGAMAGWLIRERVKSLAGILAFDQDGYHYSEEHSKSGQPTFIRRQK